MNHFTEGQEVYQSHVDMASGLLEVDIKRVHRIMEIRDFAGPEGSDLFVCDTGIELNPMCCVPVSVVQARSTAA